MAFFVPAAFSFCAGNCVITQVLRPRHVICQRHLIAQLDHDGVQDFGPVQDDSDKDDAVLAAVRKKLMSVGRIPLVMNFPARQDDESSESDDEACYLLDNSGADNSWSMIYQCPEPPVDNSNLVCEEQADGMGWICESNGGHYGV